jgi:hypothetical protein
MSEESTLEEEDFYICDECGFVSSNVDMNVIPHPFKPDDELTACARCEAFAEFSGFGVLTFKCNDCNHQGDWQTLLHAENSLAWLTGYSSFYGCPKCKSINIEALCQVEGCETVSDDDYHKLTGKQIVTACSHHSHHIKQYIESIECDEY